MRRILCILVLLSVASPPAWSAPSPRKQAKKLLKKGRTALKSGDAEKALNLWLQAVELAPESTALRLSLGKLLKQLGRCEEALLHYQSYRALDPKAGRGLLGDLRECVTSLEGVARLSVNVAEGGTGTLALAIDRAPLGRAPIDSLILGAGEYRLQAFIPGSKVYTYPLVLVADEGQELTLEADGSPAPAELSFDLKPPGAVAYLEGQPVEGESLSLAPGTYKLLIKEAEGRYHPYEQELTLGPGAQELVEIELEGRPSRLLVNAPVGAVLTLDGEPVPLAKAQEVVPGEHEVRVLAPGHLAWFRKVKIETGEQRTLDVELVPEPPLVDIRKVGFYGGVGAGTLALVGGLWMGMAASGQFSDIKDRIDGGGPYASPSELDEVDSAQQSANLLFVTALIAGSGAAVAFYWPELSPMLGFGASPTPHSRP